MGWVVSLLSREVVSPFLPLFRHGFRVIALVRPPVHLVGGERALLGEVSLHLLRLLLMGRRLDVAAPARSMKGALHAYAVRDRYKHEPLQRQSIQGSD